MNHVKFMGRIFCERQQNFIQNNRTKPLFAPHVGSSLSLAARCHINISVIICLDLRGEVESKLSLFSYVNKKYLSTLMLQSLFLLFPPSEQELITESFLIKNSFTCILEALIRVSRFSFVVLRRKRRLKAVRR